MAKNKLTLEDWEAGALAVIVGIATLLEAGLIVLVLVLAAVALGPWFLAVLGAVGIFVLVVYMAARVARKDRERLEEK